MSTTTIYQAAAKVLQANADVLADSQNALLEHIFEGGDAADFLPAWELDPSIDTLVVPEGVTRLGTYSFAYRDVREVILPSSLTEIGMAPFARYISGAQLGSIEGYVQQSLRSVVFASPSSLRVIGNSALSETQMDQMVIPEGVTTVDKFAFAMGYGSTAVFVLPESLESISFAAFADSFNALNPENFSSSVFDITFKGKTMEWVEQNFAARRYILDEEPGGSVVAVVDKYYYLLGTGSVIHCSDGDLTIV